MSMPSNTNPKLAKMQKTASRKTMTAQRGTVFHALGCKSSRDSDRFMPFPKHDTTRQELCAEFCKRRASEKPEIGVEKCSEGWHLIRGRSPDRKPPIRR